MHKVLLVAVVCLAFGPAAVLLAVASVMNPAAQASCLPTGPSGLEVGPIPEELVATTSDGTPVRLDRRQLGHAATIILAGGVIKGAGQDGVTIALMAALTESNLLMLANRTALPGSVRFPHDGDGGDHDSLGLFQMRPSTGWGTVAQLMDPNYQARAFLGGATGPNRGSPRGLLDVPGWQSLTKGAAVQAVEASAYPDRYAHWEPVATAVIDALTHPPGGEAPETGRVVLPLPSGVGIVTSGFGMRIHPITGESKLHTGVDYAAPSGTPILAAADGRVAFAGPAAGYGYLILIEHTVAGQEVASGYAHMENDGIHVRVGEQVIAGQHIADVGMSGYTTGPHLHFEIRPGGTEAPPVDPEPWLSTQGATSLDPEEVGGEPGCGDSGGGGPATAYPGGNSSRLVDDPTSEGLITERTAHVLAQLHASFTGATWACWSPRPGTSSEHPLGRACDATFGNAIGTPATSSALTLGWRVTNWLKVNAQTLGVEYLIWQGHIWSLARTGEGWRPYGGGGMHDPAGVTGGHFDHLHVTVAA